MKAWQAKWLTAMVLVMLSVALGAQGLSAQGPAMKRTILHKSDISAPVKEVVQAMVDLPGGVRSGRHTHPGEEVGYVLEGSLLLAVDGKPSSTVKAGDTFLVEAGRIHETINEGPAPAKILATYMVEKGKPLATPVP
jgi:quercetin dioxygenase-like cupin family protein